MSPTSYQLLHPAVYFPCWEDKSIPITSKNQISFAAEKFLRNSFSANWAIVFDFQIVANFHYVPVDSANTRFRQSCPHHDQRLHFRDSDSVFAAPSQEERTFEDSFACERGAVCGARRNPDFGDDSLLPCGPAPVNDIWLSSQYDSQAATASISCTQTPSPPSCSDAPAPAQPPLTFPSSTR
jgi:hypothetical protein